MNSLKVLFCLQFLTCGSMAAPIAGWQLIYDGDADANFISESAATDSPEVLDGHRTSMAANFPVVMLEDGNSIVLAGTVRFSVELAAGQFGFGLFDGDNPVAVGQGDEYSGFFAEAPTTSARPLWRNDAGPGKAHPFVTSGSAVSIGTMSNPNFTPAPDRPLSFSLAITRSGSTLDLEASIAGGSYASSVSISEVAPNPSFTFDRVAFFLGDGFVEPMTATFSNIDVTVTGDASPHLGGVGERLFGVEFNRNDIFGSPSQSLFRIVGGSATQDDNASSYTKMIGGHQVTVSQPSAIKFEFHGANGDDLRAIPGGDISMSFLVADFIGTREGAINLEITGLAAGNYVFRSYHLDTYTGSILGFAQGATTTTPNVIEARVGGELQATVTPTALGSLGLNTTFIDDSQVPTLEFSLSHDGASPLVIELRATESNGVDNFLLLNGFEFYETTP